MDKKDIIIIKQEFESYIQSYLMEIDIHKMGINIEDTLKSLIVSAELQAAKSKTDHYIIKSNNGITIINQDDYDIFVEKEIKRLKDVYRSVSYDEVTDETIDEYISSVIIYYVDHLKLPDQMKELSNKIKTSLNTKTNNKEVPNE